MKLLRNFPPLRARQIIQYTLTMTLDLDEELYHELVTHPFL
jgi:hypothetical protein